MQQLEFTSDNAKTRRFSREPITTKFERAAQDVDDTVPIEVIELPEPEDKTEPFTLDVQYIDVEVYDPRKVKAEDSEPYDLIDIRVGDSEPYDRIEIAPIAGPIGSKPSSLLRPFAIAAALVGAFALGLGAAFAM